MDASTVISAPVHGARQAPLVTAMGLDRAVGTNGYRWWYIDGISDDGRHALTLIAFVGSVFSPYYAAARRHGPADPTDFVSLNVGLYGASGHRWAMTERGRRAASRDARGYSIGPSALRCTDEAITVDIDEVTVPWPSRIRGSVRVTPRAVTTERYRIDSLGRHHWQPVAPCARIEVRLQTPSLHWSGHGYVDCNEGSEALEAAFESWQWSRATLADGATAVLYDVRRLDGSEDALALRIGIDGQVQRLSPPPASPLPSGFWGVARRSRSDAGTAPRLVSTLEDGPFYVRSLVGATLAGEPVVSVHESLSLARFRRRLVQLMLPFKMPRRG